jgi:hypothetical protein
VRLEVIFLKTIQEQSDRITTQESLVESLGLQFIKWEAENVRERNLEVQYLITLGINVLHGTLEAGTTQMELLPTWKHSLGEAIYLMFIIIRNHSNYYHYPLYTKIVVSNSSNSNY